MVLQTSSGTHSMRPRISAEQPFLEHPTSQEPTSAASEQPSKKPSSTVRRQTSEKPSSVVSGPTSKEPSSSVRRCPSQKPSSAVRRLPSKEPSLGRELGFGEPKIIQYLVLRQGFRSSNAE